MVFARYSYQDGSTSTNIVAAKTKVAPSIATSIPRLELMGAVVGVRLAKRIATVIEIPIRRATFWSDSVNVLWWIRGRSRQFKPFVANRVGEIQSSTDPEQWRYVPTSVNPADILSRGMKAKELKVCNKWWKGPDFLLQSEETWPLNKVIDKPCENAELKGTMKTIKRSEVQMAEKNYYSHTDGEIFDAFVTMVELGTSFTVDPHRYSSWNKLKRITAWINRFTDNCKKQKEERKSGELLTDEIKVAEIQLIKEVQ